MVSKRDTYKIYFCFYELGKLNVGKTRPLLELKAYTPNHLNVYRTYIGASYWESII